MNSVRIYVDSIGENHNNEPCARSLVPWESFHFPCRIGFIAIFEWKNRMIVQNLMSEQVNKHRFRQRKLVVIRVLSLSLSTLTSSHYNIIVIHDFQVKWKNNMRRIELTGESVNKHHFLRRKLVVIGALSLSLTHTHTLVSLCTYDNSYNTIANYKARPTFLFFFFLIDLPFQ